MSAAAADDRPRRIAAAVLAGALATLLSSCHPEGQDAPNLLIVTLDTTRGDRFGFSGHESAHTPNFDRFVSERAVWFENAISAVPITFPSHTTIMTGTYPVFHGVHDNDGYFLDEEVTTLAEILSDTGFTTGAVLAAFPLDSGVNLDQGFETYDDDFQADWSPAEVAARGPLSFGFVERKSDRVNLAAQRWLRDHAQDRFFLWVHYFDPHQPYDPPPPYDSQFAADLYDGEIAFMDESFGQLLGALEAQGVLDDTIVVVVGDHGESLEEHGEPTHAHFVYDAALRVPLLIAVPEGVALGGSSEDLPTGRGIRPFVRTLDVAPTILELLGLPKGTDMQGRSLVPLLVDPSPSGWEPEPALLETYYNRFNFGWSPIRGLRTEDTKLIEAPTLELYDLADDPDELFNLAPREPGRSSELREQLHRLARRMGTSDPGRSTATQVDPETRAKLEALGYLGGGAAVSERAAPFPDPETLATLPDPKDRTLAIRHLNFIHEMLRHRKFEEAIPLIRRTIDLDPGNSGLYLSLARAYGGLGHYQKALEAIVTARTFRPDDPQAMVMLATVQTMLQNHEAALDAWTRAVELAPQQVSSLRQLAATLLALGRYEEAADHFEAALELDEGSWAMLTDLATTYRQLGRTEEARSALQRALELNPYSGVLRHRIGAFYLSLGERTFARRMFEEALRLQPNHLGARLGIGQVLLEEGHPEEARPYLEEVIESGPETIWAEQARGLLGQASTS